MTDRWAWLNHGLLLAAFHRMKTTAEHERVIDALEAVLSSPLDPFDIDVHLMHGRPPASEDRWVAWLPDGWYLVYRPYVDGPAPFVGNHVVVLGMKNIREP